MRHTKYAVLVTLYKVMIKHGKYWSTASQTTILRLLRERHRIIISRRQLNYHLADLRNNGLVFSIKRNGRTPDGTLIPRSTANSITIKGYRYLIVMGIKEAWHRLRVLMRKYLPEPKPKTDQQKPASNQDLPPKKTGKNPFLNPDFRRGHGLKEIPPFTPVNDLTN